MRQDAEIILPHDGVNENNVTGERYEDYFRDAWFKTRIPNQGKGAAAQRIEAVRRLAPNSSSTKRQRRPAGKRSASITKSATTCATLAWDRNTIGRAIPPMLSGSWRSTTKSRRTPRISTELSTTANRDGDNDA